MALIRVKENFQLTLPAKLRKRARVAVGDVLEAEFEGDKIVLSFKDLVARSIAEGRADIAAGRSKSFDNVEDLIEDLHKETRARRKRK